MKAFKVERTITNEEKMQHYNKLKEKHGILLLFRCGDWYEAYAEDAQVVADELNIVVTKQDGFQLAAFPHMALDCYLPRLIRAGNKIAICDFTD